MPRLREPIKTLKKEELFEAPPPEKEKVETEATTETPVIDKKPEVKEPEQDEASLALKKQLDKIRESEALVAQYQRERDEAIKRAREQEVALAKQQRQRVESQYESVAIALKAAKEKLDFAERDLRSAKANGDVEAEIEATKRMTRANAEIMTLEPGRDELKDKRREEKKKYREIRDQVKQQPQQQRPPTVEEVIAKAQLPPAESQWLRNNPEYVTDLKKWQQLASISTILQNRGITAGHPEFLPQIEAALEYFNGGGSERTQSQPQQRTSIVSAPVSREVPSGGPTRRGQQTLTAEEREFARISGITEAEYAKQKMKLQELKATGDERYGGQR